MLLLLSPKSHQRSSPEQTHHPLPAEGTDLALNSKFPLSPCPCARTRRDNAITSLLCPSQSVPSRSASSFGVFHALQPDSVTGIQTCPSSMCSKLWWFCVLSQWWQNMAFFHASAFEIPSIEAYLLLSGERIPLSKSMFRSDIV